MKKFPLKTLPLAVMAISAALAPSAEATEWGAGTQIVGGFDFAIASRAGREVLIAQCRKHLTGYKVPKQVEFRADLPRTNVGKILRRALKEGA